MTRIKHVDFQVPGFGELANGPQVVAGQAMTYRDLILADNPLAYWRLGETAGTTAGDEQGQHDGTYLGTVSPNQSALINDSNPAATFNGTNAAINVGTLGNLGGQLGAGFTLSCWLRTSNTTDLQSLCGIWSSTSLGRLVIRMNARLSPFEFALGRVAVSLRDSNNLRLNGYTNFDNQVTDNQPHHLGVSINPATNTITIIIDGTSRTVTYTDQESPAAFSNFDRAFYLAGFNNDAQGGLLEPFNGTLDEMAIYNTVLPAATLAGHHAGGL